VGRARGRRAAGGQRPSPSGGRAVADAAGGAGGVGDLRPSAFYARRPDVRPLAETAARWASDPASLGFSVLFFSGEPGPPASLSTRALIEQTLRARCCGHGKSWPRCRRGGTNGMRQPHRHAPLAGPRLTPRSCVRFVPALPTAEGTTRVSLTSSVTAQPMIRLVSSGDRARWVDEPVSLRPHLPRAARRALLRPSSTHDQRAGRTSTQRHRDTTLPSRVECFGGSFRVIVSRREAMDELSVRVVHRRGTRSLPRRRPARPDGAIACVLAWVVPSPVGGSRPGRHADSGPPSSSRAVNRTTATSTARLLTMTSARATPSLPRAPDTHQRGQFV